MKAFFPWRFISPRRGYFREIKVARACPEISHLIDKAAFYKLCERFTMLPLAIIFVMVLPFVYLIELGKRLLTFLSPLLPDFSNRRRKVIDEIYKIVPLEQMRERAGLEPLPKITLKRNGKVVDDAETGVLNAVEER